MDTRELGTLLRDERARYAKLAMFKLGEVQAAQRMPMDAPIGRWS